MAVFSDTEVIEQLCLQKKMRESIHKAFSNTNYYYNKTVAPEATTTILAVAVLPFHRLVCDFAVENLDRSKGPLLFTGPPMKPTVASTAIARRRMPRCGSTSGNNRAGYARVDQGAFGCTFWWHFSYWPNAWRSWTCRRLPSTTCFNIGPSRRVIARCHAHVA
jgi:hypothetical protein